MEDESAPPSLPFAQQWKDLVRISSRPSTLLDGFSPYSSPETLKRDLSAPVLCVGAGGLGCELLKDLALSGFSTIHVIDMDTIDVSNLNRQFLFRAKDVGRSKAQVAAEFINRRVPSSTVIPHYCAIEDKGDEFYRQFKVIVCGLDSVTARRWINSKVCDLLQYDEEGQVVAGSVIPVIDGGTEGLKGHVKMIVPTMSSCFECVLPLFPPPQGFPMCTIQEKPRLPEHCVAWAKLVAWDRDRPFGEEALDADNPLHMHWLFSSASDRAASFSIQGVTLKLTQGVVKNIIPAVASTNAIVSAFVVLEALKVVTEIGENIEDFINSWGEKGHHLMASVVGKVEGCAACDRRTKIMTLSRDQTLQQFLDHLTSLGHTQPSLSFHSRTLFLSSMSSNYLDRLSSSLFSLLDSPSHGPSVLTLTDSSSQVYFLSVSFSD